MSTENKITRGDYGYTQTGNRYYWKRGAATKFTQGFKSKEQAKEWIEDEHKKYNLDWQVGFTIKLKNKDCEWVLTDKNSNQIKY